MLHSIFYQILLTAALLGCALVRALPVNNTLDKRQSAGVYRTCGGSGQYAITLDDGPYEWHRESAQQLSNAGAKGTYFLNGRNYGCIYDYAEQMQEAYSMGHVLGSHSWGHEDISTLSDEQLEENLSRVEEAFRKILGVKPALFRPPYGSYSEANLNVLARRGYSVILWNADTGDSAGGDAESAKAVFDNAAWSYPSPGISLQHETRYDSTHDVLQHALWRLGDAGYQLTTVSSCLGISPYQEVYTDQLPQRDDSWYCY